VVEVAVDGSDFFDRLRDAVHDEGAVLSVPKQDLHGLVGASDSPTNEDGVPGTQSVCHQHQSDLVRFATVLLVVGGHFLQFLEEFLNSRSLMQSDRLVGFQVVVQEDLD
jgi:hypothetical protein